MSNKKIKPPPGLGYPDPVDEDFVYHMESTFTIIETPDTFLERITSTYFSDQETIDKIKELLADGDFKQIGDDSAVGQSFANDDLVIKVSKYCPSRTKAIPKLVNKLCLTAQTGDIIYHIPNTLTKKYTVAVPNYLSEAIVSILLNKLEEYTPSFVYTYGAAYDMNSPEKVVYMLMDKLEPLEKYIITKDDFCYLYFQLFQALDVAQRLTKFTHYDLHPGNFLIKKQEKKTLRIFPLYNGKYLYAYTGYDVAIIDFGMSRIETENHVVCPRLSLEDSKYKDILDYYSFSPYYDLSAVIFSGQILMDKLIKNFGASYTQIFEAFSLIIKLFFNNEDLKEALRIMDIMKVNYWRPEPDNISIYSSQYRLCNAREMATAIVSFFVPYISSVDPVFISNQIKTSKFAILNSIYDLNSQFDSVVIMKNVYSKDEMDITFFPNLYLSSNENIENLIEIKNYEGKSDFISLTNGNIDMKIKPFDNSVTSNAMSDGNMMRQYIHIAKISNMPNSGYSFRFDCCRMDVKNYFQTSLIKSGIAINATFFNLGTNFEPVGDFKNSDYNSAMNDVPQEYVSKYAGVVINEYGNLDIVDLKDVYRYSQYMMCGPRLVKGGSVLITSDVLENERDADDNLLWNCRRPKTVDPDRNVDYFAEGIMNCDKIKPGQLSHAANSNPRSALLITTKGKVKFIYVEGRDERGVGMRLDQLAQLCKLEGAFEAVNLDGGRSSNMVWKTQNEAFIRISNPNRAFVYPVGSVISFVKM